MTHGDDNMATMIQTSRRLEKIRMLSLSTVTTTMPGLSWDSVLSPHIWVFDVAFVVSFIFTPVMRQVAIYYGIIDQPDQIRKLHTAPVAYLGGVAVFIGWVAGLAMSQVHIPIDEIGSPHLQVKLNIVLGRSRDHHFGIVG